MKIRAILFDLDGTLIDQFEPIHRSFSETLTMMGYPAPSYEEVKRAVGGASEATMRKLIGPDRVKEAVPIQRAIFERHMLEGVRTLPHTLDGLKKLSSAGISSAVLTNKHGPHARAACDFLNLSTFLKFTLGANDTDWKKPDPRLTNLAIKKLGSKPEETLYVGDSPYDFETAKNAGLSCYLVSTGTHSYSELSRLAKGNVFKDFKSLICKILLSLGDY